MGRPCQPLPLSDQERDTLTMWVRSGKTEHRLVRRAETILLVAAGRSWSEVCERTGLSQANSLKWVRRFRAASVEGLRDRPRSGRPPIYSATEKLAVTALACAPPPPGQNTWTHRDLAQASQMSRSTVHRILEAGALKPHRIDYWCGKSPDPEFEAKQAAILGLYLDPPDNALVLSVDEKSQIQALDRTQPELPMKPGHPRRQTATYTRHGTVCLLAALAVHEGRVDARCVKTHAHQDFLAFLKHLYRRYPHRHLHIICDNFSAHKHAAVKEWAAHRRRLTLHFTPTYASWLNQVEIWFRIFTRDVLRGGVWHSTQELVRQIMAYIDHYNQTRAKPFRWTYTGQPLAA